MKKFWCLVCVLCLFASLVGVGGCDQGGNLTSYQITCELKDNELTGKEKVIFYNHTENAIKELKFNLFGNAFREGAKYNPISAQYLSKAYPNGVSYGKMGVSSVTNGKDKLEFNIQGEDENILSVYLAEEVYPNQTATVEIDFFLRLANVVARTGYTDMSINLANFYPILCAYDNGFYECLYYANGDPFYSDCASYTVTLTCDTSLNIATSGKLIQKSDDGATTTATYSLPCARSFAMVLSKDFESVVDTSTGVEITYYFYNDSQPNQALECAVKAVKLFSEKFGAFPYKTYSVVQTKFVQGGMEFAGLVMISDELEREAYCEVIVHETAHQWWQSAVGNNEIEYGFLDEGLAQYSVVVFYENHPEYGMKREQMIKNSEKTFKVFCSVSDKLFGKVNTSMTRSLKDFKSEYEYVNIAYVKPCIMYDYLRTTVGDKAFFSSLKKYYEKYKFKNVTPDHLVGAFEKNGTGTNGYFKSFFDGKEII